MLSCKEVTHLLSDGQDRKLTIGERINLEMHLARRKGATNYRKQMDFLREACSYVGKTLDQRGADKSR